MITSLDKALEGLLGETGTQITFNKNNKEISMIGHMGCDFSKEPHLAFFVVLFIKKWYHIRVHMQRKEPYGN